MADKPFPIEQIQPTGGTFGGSPHDYSLTVSLATFELMGQALDTEIIFEGIDIPDGSVTALANKQFSFPVSPEDGYVDGSIYLCNVHNPVDATQIAFGTPNGNILPTELDVRFVFEFEGIGYANVKTRLAVDVEHTV